MTLSGVSMCNGSYMKDFKEILELLVILMILKLLSN